MHFADEVREGFLNHGPAPITELVHRGLLSFFPERQGFQERSFTGGCERQYPAAVAAFRREQDKPLLLKRPKIARQCRTLHLQGVG